MATVTIRPSSDAGPNAGTPMPTSTDPHYSVIDEEVLDTGDYLQYAPEGAESFGWTNGGLTDETINKVTVYLVGNADIAYAYYSWGSFTQEDSDLLSNNSNTWSKEYTVNPADETVWQISDFNDVGYTVLRTGSKATPIVYQFYIIIDYSANGGSTGIPKHFLHYAKLRSN